MQSSKECQGGIIKLSLVINAKKQREMIEWERLEISSRKLEITRECFHAEMGTIKDRNAIDLTEAEDIKKRWQQYTKEVYKIDLYDPDNHDVVITHLECPTLCDLMDCSMPGLPVHHQLLEFTQTHVH